MSSMRTELRENFSLNISLISLIFGDTTFLTSLFFCERIQLLCSGFDP